MIALFTMETTNICECVEKLCFGCRELLGPEKTGTNRCTSQNNQRQRFYKNRIYLLCNTTATLLSIRGRCFHRKCDSLSGSHALLQPTARNDNRPHEAFGSSRHAYGSQRRDKQLPNYKRQLCSDIGSLTIALDFQNRRAAAKGMRRTLILSDIYQTGLPPASLYRKVADIILHKGIERLIGIGLASRITLTFQSEKEFYPTTESFCNNLTRPTFIMNADSNQRCARISFRAHLRKTELKQHENHTGNKSRCHRPQLQPIQIEITPRNKIICMVKAFGYGAGSYELAKTLQTEEPISLQ